MNVALRVPTLTREQFLAWVENQDESFEFDGFQPVAKNGGNVTHNAICQNLWAALRVRLKGGKCTPMGPDIAVATIGDAIRYPDALVTCTPVDGDVRIVPGVVTVFEVLSPTSGRVDRIDKVREYAAVPTILHYVLIERTSAALTSFHRTSGHLPWNADIKTGDEVLPLPEIGIELPVAELYEAVSLPNSTATPDPASA